MRAWRLRAFAKPYELHLTDSPIPQPHAGEVLIRNHAAGLAFGETLIFDGTYQKKPELPYVPSNEGAGIVVSCGPGARKYAHGDRVMVFSADMRGGNLAEYSVMPESFVFPCPAHLKYVDAAASIMNYWTSYNALIQRGGLKAGETLVVYGATGGVGATAIEIGKVVGARIIAVGGDDERLSLVNGADERINYNKEPLRETLLQLTQGRGADMFFDPVGGDLFDAAMRAIAPGGRILVVGFASGRPALPRTNILLVKMASVIGVEARRALLEVPGGWDHFNRMLGMIERGELTPRAGRIFKFEDAPAGYEHIVARRHVGKCVVSID